VGQSPWAKDIGRALWLCAAGSAPPPYRGATEPEPELTDCQADGGGAGARPPGTGRNLRGKVTSSHRYEMYVRWISLVLCPSHWQKKETKLREEKREVL